MLDSAAVPSRQTCVGAILGWITGLLDFWFGVEIVGNCCPGSATAASFLNDLSSRGQIIGGTRTFMGYAEPCVEMWWWRGGKEGFNPRIGANLQEFGDETGAGLTTKGQRNKGGFFYRELRAGVANRDATDGNGR